MHTLYLRSSLLHVVKKYVGICVSIRLNTKDNARNAQFIDEKCLRECTVIAFLVNNDIVRDLSLISHCSSGLIRWIDISISQDSEFY